MMQRMTAGEYLRSKWPASAKRWALFGLIAFPAQFAVKAQDRPFDLSFVGLMLLGYAMLIAFTWTMSAITLWAVGAFQASGRPLPDWATKRYNDD